MPALQWKRDKDDDSTPACVVSIREKSYTPGSSAVERTLGRLTGDAYIDQLNVKREPVGEVVQEVPKPVQPRHAGQGVF